jgi:hypothetical protein
LGGKQHWIQQENNISLLVGFLEQGNGKLSERSRKQEFSALT